MATAAVRRLLEGGPAVWQAGTARAIHMQKEKGENKRVKRTKGKQLTKGLR